MVEKTALDLYRSKLLSTALVSNSIQELFKQESDWFKQAKQMEKEQILNAYKTADQYVWKSTRDEAAEQYYNETYKP